MIDTDVLTYAADADSPFHRPCRDLFEKLRMQAAPWYLTWNVVHEYLRITTHPEVFKRPWLAEQSLHFLDTLAASASLSMLLPTEQHGEILRELLRDVPNARGNLMHDANTVTLCANTA